MAVIISEEQAAKQLQECKNILQTLIRQRKAFANQIKAMQKSGQSPSSISTFITDLLTPWDTLRDELADKISEIPGDATAVQIEFTPGTYLGTPSFYVKPYDQGIGAGVIRINPEHEEFVSPFYQMFLDNDYIRISNAADENMNGRYRVEKAPGTAQEDVISNGIFTNTTGWTEASGNVSITGGQAVFTSANGSGDKLYQAKADMATSWTNAKLYLVTLTLSSISGGSLNIGTNTNTSQATLSSNGTYNVIIEADNHANGLVFTPTSFTGNLDSVSAIGWTGLKLTTAFYNDVNVDYTSDTKMKIVLEER
jgi:hypothetical protein